MKTIRVLSEEGVDDVANFLLHDPELDTEEVIGELKQSLSLNGDNLFFLQTWDLETAELVAFMLAVNYPKSKHVVIYQVWYDEEKIERNLIDTYLHRLVLWTENFGKTKLKMESRTDSKGLIARWGFKPVSTITEFVIDENFNFGTYEDKTETPLEKEKENGTIQRNNRHDRGSDRLRLGKRSEQNKKPFVGKPTRDSDRTGGILPEVLPGQPSVAREEQGSDVLPDVSSDKIPTDNEATEQEA